MKIAGVLALFFLCLFATSSFSQTCEDDDAIEELYASNDMNSVETTVVVAIPIDVLWSFFNQPSNWPIWSWGYSNVDADSLLLCENLHINFNTYSQLPFTIPSTCSVYNLTTEDEFVGVTWSYASIGLFGIHTQTFTKLSEDTTSYYNWEKADGIDVATFSSIWQNQFYFVQQDTIIGMQCLETVYQNTGYLDISDVKQSCAPPDSNNLN